MVVVVIDGVSCGGRGGGRGRGGGHGGRGTGVGRGHWSWWCVFMVVVLIVLIVVVVSCHGDALCSAVAHIFTLILSEISENFRASGSIDDEVMSTS